MTTKEFNICLDLIREGNSKGLEDIYYEFYEKMKFIAFQSLGNLTEAEDIASSFMKFLLNNAKEIHYVEHPKAWIYKAIKNLSIDYIRKESKNTSLEDYQDYLFCDDVNYNLRDAFMKSFYKLTEIEQQIVLLHFVNGFKYKEVSEMIGRPIGTIKSDVSIIKKKLNHLKKI